MVAAIERTDLDVEEARSITDEIRRAADDLYDLLLEAHDRKAWAVLGYGSWAEYVKVEFNISRSRSYQLVDQAKVVRAIESAAGVSTSVDISEAEARAIKPVLSVITDEIRTRVGRGENPDDTVREVVAEAREELPSTVGDRRCLPRRKPANFVLANILVTLDGMVAVVDGLDADELVRSENVDDLVQQFDDALLELRRFSKRLHQARTDR